MTGHEPDASTATERLDAFARVVRARRMVRRYTDAPVPADLVDRLIDLARRAPSAGNTAPWRFLVLDTPDDVAAYWEVALGERRAGFRWTGLLHAPVLVLAYTDPEAYVARYAEDDKAATGLGTSRDAWSAPYWWIDVGGVLDRLLLGATAAGLGASLFGQFAHEPALRKRFGVEVRWRSAGTIALGWPAPESPGRSADRPRPSLDEVIDRGSWRGSEPGGGPEPAT